MPCSFLSMLVWKHSLLWYLYLKAVWRVGLLWSCCFSLVTVGCSLILLSSIFTSCPELFPLTTGSLVWVSKHSNITADCECHLSCILSLASWWLDFVLPEELVSKLASWDGKSGHPLILLTLVKFICICFGVARQTCIFVKCICCYSWHCIFTHISEPFFLPFRSCRDSQEVSQKTDLICMRRTKIHCSWKCVQKHIHVCM